MENAPSNNEASSGTSALSAGLGAWLPIEIAPTNKPVLAYWADKYGGAYGVAMFEVLGDGVDPEWVDPNDHQSFVPPTHWTPLPEAPDVGFRP